METSLVCISGVRGYEKDGVAYLHIEDAARGLGFTQIATSGNECVRWERVERFLCELKFIPTSGDDEKPHDYYIPESIFYRLCMKAKNPVAEAFQAKVADEIIPSIRKTGSYSIQKQDSYIIDDFEERALRWIEEQKEKRRLEAEKQMAQKALNSEIGNHFHDRRKDTGRCGGYVKNRNHYRAKSDNLTYENEQLKDENEVLKQLAKYNPCHTVAQWIKKNPKAFANFAIPDDHEGRRRFYDAYERYACWLSNTIPVFRYGASYNPKSHNIHICWSLVCEIARNGTVDVPDAHTLSQFSIF